MVTLYRNSTAAAGEWKIKTMEWEDAWQPGKGDYGHRISFYRVNEKVTSHALGLINEEEPLDELRIKVAKWLYN